VSAACENSEADPAAVLASVLAWFAASFGANPHVMVGDTIHFSRIFCVKVGASSIARKGTSEGPPRRIFRKAEELSRNRRPLVVSPGPLSTGEGLVRAVRDQSEERDDEGHPNDPGVSDKRLLVIEGELGAPLKAAQREGNTLSAILRMAWDSGDIAPLTKSHRIKTTGAHISIVGHITRAELTQLLCAADIWNGFANRVLWFLVRRSKQVPFPEPMSDATVDVLAKQVHSILDRVAATGRVTWSEDAKAQWAALYPKISVEEVGAFGAVTARAEAQVQRLSLIYALIDCSAKIEHRHLLAALAVWEFAKASARLIFEGVSEDQNQTKVRDLLQNGPLTQSQLNDAFSGHLTVLLAAMDEELAFLVGEDESKVAAKLIAASKDESAKAVAKAISAHKTVWESKDTPEQKKLASQASTWATRQAGHRVQCPACGNDALVFGGPISGPIRKLDGDLIVEAQEYLPSKFECVACQLKIAGLSQLSACGLGETYKATSTYDAAEYYAREDEYPGFEEDNNEP
jgi:hypothetical protein